MFLDRAVAEGRAAGSSVPSVYRYTITEGGAEVVSGLVGAASAADLLPHEETVATAPHSPSPSVEIRPVVAITEEPLPSWRATGVSSIVIDGAGREHAAGAVALEGSLPRGPYVLADGHHRRRAALATWGDRCRILTLVIGSNGAGLETGSFHRRFASAGPLPAAAGTRFDIEPMATPASVAGSIVWVDGSSGRAFRLTPRPEALATMPVAHRAAPAAVASALLYPLVGVTDEDAVWAGTQEIALADLVAGERVLLLPPIDLFAVIGAARAGEPLPPKSSRFRPKPVRGLVMRAAP